MMTGACSLCEKEDELTQMDLYVTGSEGIWICTQCNIALSQFARYIKETSFQVKLRTIKEERKRYDAKQKEKAS